MGQHKATTVSLTERLTRSKHRQKGGGTKKFGRNAAKCKLYREHQALKNALAVIKRHRAKHPDDTCSQRAYTLLLKGGV